MGTAEERAPAPVDEQASAKAAKARIAKLGSKLLPALTGSEVGLEQSAAALLLAHILLEHREGEAFALGRTEVMALGVAFKRSRPIAFHALNFANVTGFLKGLEFSGDEHAAAEDGCTHQS